MKTTITFRHMQSTPAIKDFVTDKLDRLEKYARSPMEAHVILELERYLQKAEIVLTMKRFKATGTSSTDNMYASIEEAVDKVEKALRKLHDKKVRTRTRSGRQKLAS